LRNRKRKEGRKEGRKKERKKENDGAYSRETVTHNMVGGIVDE
jgi:hypothetical protein